MSAPIRRCHRHATRFIVALAGLVIGACAQPTPSAGSSGGKTEAASRVWLAECGRDRETCLLLDGLSAVTPHATLGAGSSFGSYPLAWLEPRLTAAGPSSRVLVLVDVSGSMKVADMSAVRLAVRAFLDSIPNDGTVVAIAPFESHNVAAVIRAATLTTPATAARTLDALPEPAPNWNTGLFTAVREGADLLANAGTVGDAHLIVITDGKNDVRLADGDDPDLLQGDSGRDSAVARAAEKNVNVWIIGVGPGPSRGEVAALAGTEDRYRIVPSGFVPVSLALRDVGQRIGGRNRLVVGTAAPTWLALSALPQSIHAIIHDGATNRDLVGVWEPPLLAPPVLAPAVTDATPPQGVSGPLISWWRWALLLMPVGVVLLAAIPVTLAMDVGELAASESQVRRGAPGMLRTSVQEARPRAPDEITATNLERIVRVPGRP